MTSRLPIHSVLDALKRQLSEHDEAILEAAPGAGKTTVVPLALLDAEWLGKRKIIMLEPRRLAARSAAKRLADQLGEPLGQRVGYQIRQDGKQSQSTQLLVVTEGVLTRMLQDDPSLDDVALIIFDEFHERNLHSDFALALCLQARVLFRDEIPLKLLIMSATLDSSRLQTLLGCQPIISEGRQYPIDIRYSNLALKQPDVPLQVSKLIIRALSEEAGSLLAFLPGQREIRQVAQYLEGKLPDQTELLRLFGDLSVTEQEHVIAPAKEGWRKIILATSIAQTSLTINGIRIVVDSGLAREARFDAKTATTRLHTRSASQAETIQRMGRAGRVESGVCYRWWSPEQQQRLSPQSSPQILLEDLSSLVLESVKWGIKDTAELDWVTPPPSAHWQQADDLLVQLGILRTDKTMQLSQDGQRVSRYPLPPRLACLLDQAVQLNCLEQGLSLAAMLYDAPSRQHSSSDILSALQQMSHSTFNAQWKRSKANLKRAIVDTRTTHDLQTHDPIGWMLAKAFPDRVALRQRVIGEQVIFKLSNGRQAWLPRHDDNAHHDFIITVELGGTSDQELDKVYLSHGIELETIKTCLHSQLKKSQRCEWNRSNGGLVGEEEIWLSKLCIEQNKIQQLPDDAVIQASCDYIRKQGLASLNWQPDSLNLRHRIHFARTHLDAEIPPTTDSYLSESLEQWLAPFLIGITRVSQLEKLSLLEPLKSLLNWEQQQKLERLPTKLRVASGSYISVDYQHDTPTVRVKLQEMFGETQSPSIAGVPVKIELLSPAQRPLAVTQDLTYFWQEVYPEVRKEMRGRYPKHPWPENPLTAEATHKTNRALRER
ncbi:ATP-dependent helicase HrpB [Marinomonas piezotolerans]|uniref:ATP-dependent helicase HrpB n=1 Tax=Marinomonas piezotolerans TaxID=2213058 RepID=A0A370U521_9GAMM|nr:ATP-dependent helicase HrpB [Marinomonas piezotolerans]RDL42871.1 ATP-dependent helicase HrpB [Marinomonas piezotolerans]